MWYLRNNTISYYIYDVSINNIFFITIQNKNILCGRDLHSTRWKMRPKWDNINNSLGCASCATFLFSPHFAVISTWSIIEPTQGNRICLLNSYLSQCRWKRCCFFNFNVKFVSCFIFAPSLPLYHCYLFAVKDVAASLPHRVPRALMYQISSRVVLLLLLLLFFVFVFFLFCFFFGKMAYFKL